MNLDYVLQHPPRVKGDYINRTQLGKHLMKPHFANCLMNMSAI